MAMARTMTGTSISPDGLPFPAADPLSSLHPTAQAIIEAARAILARDGFKALSIRAITEKVGVNKAAVHYHFGNKNGLIIAIVDALIHDEFVDVVRETRSLHGEERVRAYIRGVLGMVNDMRSFQIYYELLPHILRDPELSDRMTALYSWYFDWTNLVLGFDEVSRDPERRQAFGQLLVALSDGLALQKLLNPSVFLVERPHAMLESLLYELLSGRSMKEWRDELKPTSG